MFPENVFANAKYYNKLRVYPGNRKLNIFKEATVFKSLEARKQLQTLYPIHTGTQTTKQTTKYNIIVIISTYIHIHIHTLSPKI